jgi:glycosyltransferase involved in cell wall biosynthesis
VSAKGTRVPSTASDSHEESLHLSVVIPCYNGGATIGEQLEALANQRWSKPWEVVIANNGCTDNTLEIVDGYKGRIANLRVVDASKRRGQPYALNVGVEAAASENVAICDADDVVGEGYVAAIGEALEKYDFVACRLDMIKLNPSWLTATRKFPQDTEIQKYSYPPFLAHAGGGTIGLKRRLWLAVGGVDESLPYLHDTDLCWKLQLSGTSLGFVPDAVIHTRLRHTLKGIYGQARSWGEYNVILYKRYQAYGMPKLSRKAGIKAWLQLLRDLPGYRTMDLNRRAQFVWMLAWRVGRLRGSVKNGVFAL